MVDLIFIYEGTRIKIQGNINQKMKDICNSFCLKANADINSLVFLYGGGLLNLEKALNETTKENKLSILVYDKDNELKSKTGKILNDRIIDEIISSNNNIKNSLIGISSQIENIIFDLINKKNIIYINNQLQNINIIINKINEDIKKINKDLNTIKNNDKHNNDKQNDYKPNNELKIYDLEKSMNKDEGINISNNEIICIYYIQDDEISLLHDYKDYENWSDKYKELYLEGKNNINKDNIEIYINNKKIEFNYKYKSNERGKIKVTYKFNKLLTSTCCMFYGCISLKFIDLSSFNTQNVTDISYMFYGCSSLKSINLSSFNTQNVNNMRSMFRGCSSLMSLDLSSFDKTNIKDMSSLLYGCSSLENVDLSSFNTSNVNDMSDMFYGCSSLTSIDLSSFNTFNVKDMSGMFESCSSLESIDLSSFNTTNVNDTSNLFYGCFSLKKERVKINNSESKIINKLKKIKI